MFKAKIWSCIAIVVAGVTIFGAVYALDGDGPWMRTGSPTIGKVLDEPNNIWPSTSNSDCYQITDRLMGISAMQNDCVVQNPYGLASSSGTIFTGSAETIPIVPPYPFTSLNPVIGQGMYFTYSSPQVVGMYMHFYKSIRDKMKSQPEFVNNVWQYTLNSGPDMSIRDPQGRLVPVNINAIAFSSDGNWMIADFPFQGFMRINMATFQMQPFAPSMNNGNDYSSYSAQMTISGDGRYVAVKPNSWSELKVYDLQSCPNQVMPVTLQNLTCRYRDYWPAMSAQLPTLKNIFMPRFMGASQLSLQIVYDFTSNSNFKTAQYTLTAPGENPVGIDYLGMGDSFASGQGAFSYIDGTDTTNNGCHLSSLSYPLTISPLLFTGGHSVACSGAETKDINGSLQTYDGQNTPHRTELQLKEANLILPIFSNFSPGYVLQKRFVDQYNPQSLTLSIGGNDIGFSSIIQECITVKLLHSNCYSTYEEQQELVQRIQRIGGRLQNTYRAVNAPGRRVYVIGYPQIVAPNGSCADNVRLSQNEIQMFIDLTATLNQTIKNAAANAGVQYVDVADALLGHRMCEAASSQVAVNGLTAGNDLGAGAVKVIGAESYHPNALGHQLLMQAILSRTNNLKNGNAQPVTTSSDVTTSLPYSSAPKTGRILNVVVNDTQLVPDILGPNTTAPLRIDGSVALLRGSATYTMHLDSATNTIGSASTDSAGQLSGALSVTAALPCGYHTLHVSGPNMLNQPLDVMKLVYIQPANGDCDGDGRTDTSQACGLLPPSGQDADNDGIDDGCDPVIGDPPAFPVQKVYLMGNAAHVSQ